MSTSKLTSILATSTACMLLGGCAKQSALDLGGQKITVPVPSGFTPLGNKDSKFRSFAEKEFPSRVLIEYYLTKHDLQEVLAGRSEYREKILTITMPRQMYGRDFSEESFLGASYFVRNIEGKDFLKNENAKNHKRIVMAQMQGLTPRLNVNDEWLGIFLDQKDVIGAASTSLTRTYHDAAVKKILNLEVTLRVENRYINLRCGYFVDDDAEIGRSENMCSQWAKDILKSNPEPAN